MASTVKHLNCDKNNLNRFFLIQAREGEGTPLYKLYRYVPPHLVGFFGRFGLKTGLDFSHFGLESGMVF